MKKNIVWILGESQLRQLPRNSEKVAPEGLFQAPLDTCDILYSPPDGCRQELALGNFHPLFSLAMQAIEQGFENPSVWGGQMQRVLTQGQEVPLPTPACCCV